MTKNEGVVDRSVRFVLGVFLLTLGAVTGSPWGLIGLIPIVTAGVGFCPLYKLVGVSTCESGCEPAA